jgi:GrpB-like predicted nucleotidyltransferase (UPF0157 family)
MLKLKPNAASVLIPDDSQPPIEISLVPYTPDWARDFERERQRLADAFAIDAQAGMRGNPSLPSGCVLALSITHVGSTSIAGALAKPYIDMHVSLCDIGYERHCMEHGISFFKRHGYCVYGSPDSSGHFFYLYKACQGESDSCKGYFLHFQSLIAGHMLTFAERLKSEASLVEQYNEAKRRILEDHPRIRFAEYAMLKTAFIMKVVDNDGHSWGSGTTAPLYELIHFISSTAAGHVPLVQPLPFAPNEVLTLRQSGFYSSGYCQHFTPLGLALILAVAPRLSALWNRYDPTHHHDWEGGMFGTRNAELPSSTSVSSESARLERLARFVPVIRRLRQHGCTKASFMTWMTYESSIIDAAIAGSAEFEGFAPLNLKHDSHSFETPHSFETVMGWYAELFDRPNNLDDPPSVLDSPYLRHRIRSGIYMPDLHSFGPSAVILVNSTCIAHVLHSLQLQQHLATFLREHVTDDIVGALSSEELRALGLSIGDAKRFSLSVQKELASLQDHSFPLPPPSVSAERTLASSNFLVAHEAAPDNVKKQHELFASIDGFIAGMCSYFGAPAAAAEDLFQRLQSESFENPQELLSQIQVAATRIWTSTQKLQGKGVDDALNVEFCSLINRALRDDIADVMPQLAVIVRAINALCIVRRETASLKFPPNAASHRGGALPLQHHAFFTAGKKYRVPMYLATSFSEDKAYEFW